MADRAMPLSGADSCSGSAQTRSRIPLPERARTRRLCWRRSADAADSNHSAAALEASRSGGGGGGCPIADRTRSIAGSTSDALARPVDSTIADGRDRLPPLDADARSGGTNVRCEARKEAPASVDRFERRQSSSAGARHYSSAEAATLAKAGCCGQLGEARERRCADESERPSNARRLSRVARFDGTAGSRALSPIASRIAALSAETSRLKEDDYALREALSDIQADIERLSVDVSFLRGKMEKEKEANHYLNDLIAKWQSYDELMLSS